MTADVSTDHRDLRVLSLDECLERLDRTVVGRVAFLDHGEPVVLPVVFGRDGTALVFRTSWGSKLRAAGDEGSVAIEVDEIDEATGHGWSVLVKGTASVVYDNELTERWDGLGLPFWLPGGQDLFWVRVTTEEISGREIIPG